MKNLSILTLLMVAGACGGWLAKLIGLPLPFMLGPLFVSSFITLIPNSPISADYKFPEVLRRPFIVLIGVMIGATFSPTLMQSLSTLWASFLCVFLFVIFSHVANYLLGVHLGKYDQTTAFYAGTPGGLVESIELGTQSGGDEKTITLQHFVRIILVVATVPLLLSVWTGHSVGSSAGETMGQQDFNLLSVAIAAAIGTVGFFVGKYLRFPAYFLIGPMVLSASLHGFGVADAQLPDWASSCAQVVLGTSLGTRFSGLKLKQIQRALMVGFASMVIMLLVAIVLALGLSAVSNEPAEVLFVSLAPGGVIEMGLIALSLNANPVFVAAHHVFRISIAVFALVFVKKLVLPDKNNLR